MNNQNSIVNAETARIAAAAAAAFIFVGLLAVIALAILWTPPPL
jgi:flagellar biogenesis protein FliO